MEKERDITHRIGAVVRLILWYIYGKRLEFILREMARNSCQNCPKGSEGFRHGESMHYAANIVYGFFHSSL